MFDFEDLEDREENQVQQEDAAKSDSDARSSNQTTAHAEVLERIGRDALSFATYLPLSKYAQKKTENEVLSYDELESLAESRVEDEKLRSLRNCPTNLSTQKTEAAMPARVYLPSFLHAESVSMGTAFRTKCEELDPEPSNESIAPMGSSSQPPIVLDNRNIILNCEDIWRTAGSHPFFGKERSWDGVEVAVEHYESKGYFVQGVVSVFFSQFPPPASLANVLVKSPVMDHHVENEPSIRLFTLRLAQTCGCRFVDNWNYRELSSGSGQLSLWYQRVGSRMKVEYIFNKAGYFLPLARATD